MKKALNDYNDQLAQNGRLREQIDGLKKEREVFNELQRKLGRELSDQKAAMANVIMQSNAAFETRDEAQTKMMALQEKHEKEAIAADREIKELNRVLEHERKLRDFMGQKARSRAKASCNSCAPVRLPCAHRFQSAVLFSVQAQIVLRLGASKNCLEFCWAPSAGPSFAARLVLAYNFSAFAHFSSPLFVVS